MTPQGTSIPGEQQLRTAFCTLFLSQHFRQVVLQELMNNKYTAEKKGGSELEKKNRDFKRFQQVKIIAQTDPNDSHKPMCLKSQICFEQSSCRMGSSPAWHPAIR